MSVSPSLVDSLYGLGHWLLDQQRPDDAVHVFRTLLMTAPEDERSWLGLATSHEQIGHHDAALGLYQLGEAAVHSSFRCPLARARLLKRVDGDADAAYDLAEERARLVDDATADAIAAERRAA